MIKDLEGKLYDERVREISMLNLQKRLLKLIEGLPLKKRENTFSPLLKRVGCIVMA